MDYGHQLNSLAISRWCAAFSGYSRMMSEKGISIKSSSTMRELVHPSTKILSTRIHAIGNTPNVVETQLFR